LRGEYQQEGGGGKKRLKGDKYDQNTLYTSYGNRIMKSVKIVLRGEKDER
jgi:hypothetical protein